MSAIFALEGVTKRYGNRRDGDVEAVSNLSLTLDPGRFTALIGASGCGKSTTLRLIAGLERPTEGCVLINGADVTELNAAQRNVALMFQSYALYPHLSVFDNVAMPLRLRRLSILQRLPGAGLISGHARTTKDAIKTEVGRMAELLRVSDLLDRRPGQLSGGQQQRVALARALVRAPSIFLLDEPLSNLDTQLRSETREEIRALHARTGHSFVLVTHDQADALSMADQVVVMINGRAAQIASPDTLYRKPQTPQVAAFIGAHGMNILAPGPAARALDPSGGRLCIGVRPSDLIIQESGGLAATLVDVAFHGEETLMTLRTEDGTRVSLVQYGSPALPGQGIQVQLGAPAAAIHRFDPHTEQRVEQPVQAMAS